MRLSARCGGFLRTLSLRGCEGVQDTTVRYNYYSMLLVWCEFTHISKLCLLALVLMRLYCDCVYKILSYTVQLLYIVGNNFRDFLVMFRDNNFRECVTTCMESARLLDFRE